MRVVMTTDTIGGVWTFTQELTEGLLARGCAVCLLGLGRAPDDYQIHWTCDMRERWGTRFLYRSLDAPLEWMRDNERAFHPAARVLSEVASEFGGDVFHFNQMCFGALPTELPKVVTSHSDVLSWAKACRPDGLEDSAWLRRYIALVAAGLRQADVVITPTAWMLGALAERFDLPGEYHVVPNGYSMVGKVDARRKLQAVCAGRLWDEAKNIAMLRDVRCAMPLLVAGECVGADGQVVSEFGSVRLLGRLCQSELIGLFSESAIYICPSMYEPFGLAPLEAALCGCAVLANDIHSLREVWGDAALYFEDAGSLQRLLEFLTDNPETLSAAQARSQTRAALYTREKMTTEYLKIFEDVAVRSVQVPVRYAA